jgi:malonyl-CoA/methylmalonyl-CoA synthetase
MNQVANANLFPACLTDSMIQLALRSRRSMASTSVTVMIARSGQVANVLVSNGVKLGDRVAAQTENSVTGLVLYLATVARRRGVSAAQHRLHAERARILRHRCRAHRSAV